MAFCFSGSLLRANFSIVSLFFLLDGVIVRGKEIFLLSSSAFTFSSDYISDVPVLNLSVPVSSLSSFCRIVCY